MSPHDLLMWKLQCLCNVEANLRESFRAGFEEAKPRLNHVQEMLVKICDDIAKTQLSGGTQGSILRQ